MRNCGEQCIVTKTTPKPNWGAFKGTNQNTLPTKLSPVGKKHYPNQATVGKL